jgi:hydrogenase-4 membrane subunit HyfE
MTGVDVLFLVAILVPLLAARWRISLLGLAAQGVLLWYAADGPTFHPDLGWLITTVDCLVVRGIVAPFLLYLAYAGRGHADRNDVVPPNLFVWMVVVLLVVMTLRFADQLAPVGAGDPRVGVAASALVIGFFVLATQRSVFSQIIGALRIENAVALLEIAGSSHHVDDPRLRALQLVLGAVAAGMYAWYLDALAATTPDTP